MAAFDDLGNPSSVHSEGRSAKRTVETAREAVAALVGASPDCVVFTSGASEAAATCLTPFWQGIGASSLCHLAVSDADHPCIREGGRFPRKDVTRLKVDADGRIDHEAFLAWCEVARDQGLLAFGLANSETGVLQPTSEIVTAAREAGLLTVVDAVQAIGRVPIDMRSVGADALILSGHKIGAPKGVGAFVLRSEAVRPTPLVTGGAQERRQRAGTESVPLIAGLGVAARLAAERLNEVRALSALRARLEEGLSRIDADVRILGKRVDRLPQTVAFTHSSLRAETMQIAMDLAGFAVSAGSACGSGKVGPSHVLEAMSRAGLPIDPTNGALRISFGLETAAVEVEAFLQALTHHMSKRITQPNMAQAS